MALIGKIRKNFWFVLVLLGLALAAFILMDMTGSSGPGGAVTSMTMGSIDGQKINYQDFSRTEQAYYRNAGTDIFQKRKTIWDFYVENALISKEADALGMNVSREELMDLQFGPNPSQIIQANWRNPQTGQLDVATLQQFRSTLEAGEALNPEFEAYWGEQEKQIVKDALQAKLTSLINKGVYTPSWMAEESFKMENSKADFKYVKIPFDNIDGSDIELTDADFKAYMNENKELYEETEETRVIEYASFDVTPSEDDKEAIRQSLLALKAEFIKPEQERNTTDSLFAISNKGSYSHIYGTIDQLPEVAREQISALNPGEAYGPFEQAGNMMVVKMIDKRVYPDSVTVRHILRNAVRTDAAAVANANAVIDSIKNVFKRGGKSFTDLAKEHSQDPGVVQNEGLYESFDQMQMVPEFTIASFSGKKGGLYTAQTDYGIHLIKVEDQVFNNRDNKYKIATIGQTVLPSEQTQGDMYDKVSEILSNNKTYESIKAAVDAESDVTLTSSPSIKQNDSAIGALGSDQTSRDMVIWAFDADTKVGDVSPEIYRYTDRVNYYDNKYVIATLKSINPKGMKTVASVKDQIETAVMNKKKGQKFASSLSITSLESVASQNSADVLTASDVSMVAKFVPGIGNEPKVISAAFNLDPSTVSQPIVGNSGVFVVSPISTLPASAPNNIPFLKTSLATSTKSQVGFKIMDNLKKRADITDNRSTFF